MKIAVFGGTGATGQEIIKQGLERNYHVTVLARNPAAIQQTSPNLEVNAGSIADADTVEKVIAGNDAVLSVLGFKRGTSKPTIFADGAKVLMSAMNKTDVKRLIYCTSAGVEDHDPNEMLIYRYIIKPFFLQEGYNDMKVGEALIRESNLDWTLVRPSRLTNGPKQEHFRVSPLYRSKGGVAISRADLAYFMLNQITSDEWSHKTPTLGY